MYHFVKKAVAVEPAPAFVFGLPVAVLHGGEGGLDRVGAAKVGPVLGRKVVECEEALLVLGQVGRRLGILCLVERDEVSVGLFVRFRRAGFGQTKLASQASGWESRYKSGVLFKALLVFPS